jgi:hypothetical protein
MLYLAYGVRDMARNWIVAYKHATYSNKTCHHVLLLCWIDSIKLCIVSLWLKGSSQLISHIHSTHDMCVCGVWVCACVCVKFDAPWPRHVHMSIHFVNWAYLGSLGTCTMADAYLARLKSLRKHRRFLFGYLIINHRKCVYRKRVYYDAFHNLKIS